MIKDNVKRRLKLLHIFILMIPLLFCSLINDNLASADTRYGVQRASGVSIDIKANGSDSTVTIDSGAQISLSVSLDPGVLSGQSADWWFTATTIYGPYSYVYQQVWRAGTAPLVQMPLFLLPSTVVDTLTLPIGEYIFKFSVDNNMDGILDGTWGDSVTIKVQSTGTTVADSFEPDDTYQQAGVIIVNNDSTMTNTLDQRHNFHLVGDQDWIKFYGVKDLVYTVEVLNPKVNCDAKIQLYDTDGITLLDSSDDFGTGIGETLDLKPQKDGIYYIKVTNFNSVYGNDTNYDLKVYTPTGAFPGVLTGTITDASTGQPVAGALIQVGNNVTLSFSSGLYVLVLPSGTASSLTVSAAGYNILVDNTITVQQLTTVIKNVVLTPSQSGI